MFAVTVTFRIHLERMAAFLPLMIENARASRTLEPGCRQFDICRDGGEIFLYEIYDDRRAFDAHLVSAHYMAFDAAVAGMVAEKTVRFYEEVIR
ncbi:antibiotic biosynthesis monooxygenase [Ruegeria sp. PrR005]|uniref:Antibiotic biosynthesis monooxygenase n=2 Tax=Ruegeria sp. PrR005 TaxID=2706882 RepID=A0A6B2NXZ5_9RHOB|nr:putative quinol monooxygenase [Ruegeria sp. PrR005]NDW46775.1 antibiotic biosynthesis monooxygenase [Ruegeria sp. PrR005]